MLRSLPWAVAAALMLTEAIPGHLYAAGPATRPAAAMLREYFEQMSSPKPIHETQ
jgi:hypothetical protein